MATYLLAHGAGLGGWVWKKVARRLQAAGHEVFTPTYTGLGERAHLGHSAIDIDHHIEDICAVIETEELDRFVLCGHSYGGTVITGVAERMSARIAALVYLDAWLPNSGESSFSRLGEDGEAKIRQAAAAHGDGWRVPMRSAQDQGIRDADDRAWYDRHLVGHPIGCMAQPIVHTQPWQRVPSRTFIHCNGAGPTQFDAIAAKLETDASWALHHLPCGHMAMVDLPDEVTQILIGVAP